MNYKNEILYIWDESNILEVAPFDESRVILEEPHRGKAGFSILKKYEVLYKEELKRFRKNPLKVYALPYDKTPTRIYRGLDREGNRRIKWKLNEFQKKILDKIFDAKIETPEEITQIIRLEEDAKLYLSCHKNEEDFEIVWSRIAGSDEEIPEGYKFLGYDITEEADEKGAFSIINDCMFICRWHGCDEEGKLFVEDFSKLNENGLFATVKDAYDYLSKYAMETWTETGVYGIFEIYSK